MIDPNEYRIDPDAVAVNVEDNDVVYQGMFATN